MAEAHEFEEARMRYCPCPIKLLFVAEAPPRRGSERFFCFENVPDHDSLFLETMKVLYGYEDVREVRKRKRELLERFREDGFYVIDAVEMPLPPRATPSIKESAIRKSLVALKKKISELLTDRETPLVLIGKPVFNVCLAELARAGLKVINTEFIDFPAFGHQPSFREKLKRVLERAPASAGARW